MYELYIPFSSPGGGMYMKFRGLDFPTSSLLKRGRG